MQSTGLPPRIAFRQPVTSNVRPKKIMKRFLILMMLFLSSSVNASFPLEATLDEMARGADHILIGRVIGVDMVDAKGAQITNRGERTGPGLSNTLRLRIAVDEVLVTNSKQVPKVLAVPLDPFLHYTLGQVGDAHKGDKKVRLLLLKGNDFVGIKPGVFFRPIIEKAEALRIYKK
jgi:hypothetical protein